MRTTVLGRLWATLWISSIFLFNATPLTAQEATPYGDFLASDGVEIANHCGQFWPSKGMFQTYTDNFEYSATIRFQLTEKERNALQCVGEYLELDFRLLGFAVDNEWEEYSISTNIPGGVKDTALFDNSEEVTPAVTGIKVRDLKANTDYHATIAFTDPRIFTQQVQRVSFEWVPSRWAKTTDIGEAPCKVVLGLYGDPVCIFGVTRVFLSHGFTQAEYGERQSLVFDGLRFWEFNVAQQPIHSPQPTVAAAPRPTVTSTMACSDTGIPVMSTRLSATPQNPDTATQVTLSTTITNRGCGTFAPEVLAIGGRDPAGNIKDPHQDRNFVLASGESRTVSRTVVLSAPGKHEFFMVFLRPGGGWNRIPDTNGDSSSIFVTVAQQGQAAPAAACSESGGLHMSSRLTASPQNPDTATEITLSVTLTNGSCGTFAPEVLAIGGRDPSGNVTDPLQIREFVLGPGESKTLTQTVVLTTPGTHEFFMAYLRSGGGWHRIPDAGGDSSSIYVTVSEAVAVDPAAQEQTTETQEVPTEEPVEVPTEAPTTEPQDTSIIEPVDGAGASTTESPVQSSPGNQVSEPGNSGDVDIALITRDPSGGKLLTGTCYVLVNYSNEGCDENGDGQVTFAQIVPGRYTVRQTLTPNGYPTVNDFAIEVTNSPGIPLNFIVRQSSEQNAPNSRNVSFVFIDSTTKTRDTSGICVEMVGASNIGCDQDLIDGQVDFIDVPVGDWPVSFTNVPSGWQVRSLNGSDYANVSNNQSTHIMYFYEVSTSGSGAGSDNVIEPTGLVQSSASQSSGSENVNQATTPDGSATLVMTMRGCPEGFNPNSNDFFASCTIPLDAPDASYLYHGGDGQGGVNIMWMDRQYNGGYIFNAGPNTMNVRLGGLAPVVRDGYTVIGADSQNGSEFYVNLQNGETREVWVFYYYWP